MEVLHIGFPKTATTTFQAHVFARHPGLLNIARPFRDDAHERLWTSLAVDDDMDYAENELARLVAQYRAGGDRVMLYSDETVVNTPIRSIAAKRLKRLFPDAIVVAVLRSQFSALVSYYHGPGWALNAAPEPYRGSHVSFGNFLGFGFAQPDRSPYFKTIRYSEILDLYAGLFGRDRVHVLLYENFMDDRAGFVNRLSSLLGIDGRKAQDPLGGGHENPAAKDFDIWHRKLRRRFLRDVPISRFVPGSRHVKRGLERMFGRGHRQAVLDDAWRGRIAQAYGPGNRAVAAAYGLDLEKHGYPL